MGTLVDILAAEGVHLRDLRATLPVNPNRKWMYRELDCVKGAIVHHTVGKTWYTSDAIARMHIALGWPGMAYTFYIHEEGPAWGSPIVTDFDHRLRDWGPQAGEGPHSVNPETFGVALAGNWVSGLPEPEVQDAMIAELVRLMRGLQEFFVQEVGHSLYIKPHYFVSATQCPGLAWDKYLAAIGCG